VAAALALFTSAAYGVANYIGPRLARDAPILLLLTISQGASLALAALVVAASGGAPPGAGALGWALLAGLGNASGLVFFYRAAEIGPLSIVTSVGSIGVGIPVAVGLAGGESVGTAQVAGMVLAISGVLLVSRRPPAAPAPVPGALSSGSDHVEEVADDHHARRRAIGLALLAPSASVCSCRRSSRPRRTAPRGQCSPAARASSWCWSSWRRARACSATRPRARLRC
jgi:uncharacterized membrane protein